MALVLGVMCYDPTVFGYDFGLLGVVCYNLLCVVCDIYCTSLYMNMNL